MDDITVLILGKPGQAQLDLLKRLDDKVRILFAESSEDAARQAPQADVIFAWAPKRESLQGRSPARDPYQMDPRAFRRTRPRLVSRTDGDPYPVHKWPRRLQPVARGIRIGRHAVFREGLRAAVRRSQQAARWEPFDVLELGKQTLGIIGYGDIGRACARRAKAMGTRVLALRRRPELSAADPHVDGVYGWDQRTPGNDRPIQGYVVAAAPWPQEIKGMIGDAEFAP